MKKFKSIIKSFFYRKNSFQPVYFWITMFLIPVLVTFWLKIIIVIHDFIQKGDIDLSDTLILGVLAFVQIWAGLFNWQNIKQNNNITDDGKD